MSYPKNCPVHGTPMGQTDFNGVQIDQCFTCHGVWFDPGELEIAIARVSTMPGYNPQHALNRHQTRPVHGYHHDSSGHHQGYYHDSSGHRSQRRGGFLQELFD